MRDLLNVQVCPRAGYDPQPSSKWFIPARIVLLLLLLSLTAYTHSHQRGDAATFRLIIIYYLILTIAFLSFFPAFFKARFRFPFTNFQLSLDTLIVSLIVLITGGSSSFFSFLYLLVIIYASMVLYMFGGLLIAALSSIQYAVLVVLEYQGVLLPITASNEMTMVPHGWVQVCYKILITTAACCAVAFLSGLLTEQNRRSQQELKDLSAHVKRVEKMAYMGEMAAGLAHEIKNPLASLVGSIQMLKDEFHYDPDHERLMEIILRETDRLSTLVNDFLFFARPPAGKPMKLNLKEAVEEIIALFEQDANHCKHFTLVKKLLNHSWVVMDPMHLRQVMWNLLLNAAEAVGDDGVIEIETLRMRNNEIGIQIKDNGCGMPSEVAQSMFDPFYTTKPEGTGLGLSIVHRILEAYGSRLDVKTREQAGTTIMYTLKQTNPPG